jgi:hypothetical protein
MVRLRTLTAALVVSAVCWNVAAGTTTVHFRLIDGATGRTTPAMCCITGSDSEVRVPPDGRVTTQPSRVPVFVEGIRYSADRNWIGPIRKTMGKGDNDDRAWVYEMRPSIPYWREPVMFQVSGDFTIDLPPGRWRVAVQRGMEYVPVVEEFQTGVGGGTLTKELTLERWVHLPERGWWTGDVHVHHPILEEAHREYLLSYAEAEDLHVVNVLEMGDHRQTFFRQLGFGKEYRVCRQNYCLAAGQEDPRSTFGHIIGLDINALARDTGVYDFYDVAFRKIRENGGLVGFSHFAWNGCDLPRGFPWYVTTGDIDFIEVLQFSVINAMDYYDYLNLGFRLTAAAGSDVPWGSTIGEVRTVVHTGSQRLDLDEWFAAFRKGHTFVTNGPVLEFTVDGRLPGSEIDKPGGGAVKVVARVWGHPKVGLPAALTVVGNDGVVREVLNEQRATEMALEFELPVRQSQWLVASTVCDNNAVAHTTPVYVVVDAGRHGPPAEARP